MQLLIRKKLTKSRVIRQYIAAITCALSMTVAGMVNQWPAPAILKIKNNETLLKLTNPEIGWVVSMLHVGSLVCTLPCGYLMDRIGRKATLLYSMMFSIISWIIIYFATQPYHLFIARFLSGISNGVAYIILPVYMGEISEPELRGLLGSLSAIMLNLGFLIEYCIGLYVSYYSLAVLSCLTIVAFVVAFSNMPETPLYYLMKNDESKAMESLVWLRKDKQPDDILKELKSIDASIKKQMIFKGTYKDLISIGSKRKSLIIAVALAMFQRLTGVFTFLAYSWITIPENSLSWLSLSQCIMILSAIRFVSTLLAPPVLLKIKRKSLLIASNTVCFVSTLTVSIWFYTKEHTSFTFLTDLRWMPFVSFIAFMISYGLGMGPVCTMYRGEIFSSDIKGKASAFCMIISFLTAIVLNKSYLTIADNYGMYLNYLIYSICGFTSIFFFKYYLIETKDKTLQNIQDELNEPLINSN